MSDWVLIGLTAVLVVLLLLTLLGFAAYSGLFAEVVVRAGAPPMRSITVAYKFRLGPYADCGNLFTESCSIAPKLPSLGVYYDNPYTVPAEKCRYIVGSILSEGDEKPTPEMTRLFQKYAFKFITFPELSHVVMATFPYTTPFSIQLATNRVHPALDTYIKERKLCAHPWIEIYKGDKIYFVCPLSRQGDFYVPEMKAIQKKSQMEMEGEDRQTDNPALSDTSSVTVEALTESRETSVATTITTTTPAVRGRAETDNRSEHSYSESGTSGSSFEELDLEASGEGAGGVASNFSGQPEHENKGRKEHNALEKERGVK
ncbi:testis-expressed protein 264 [Rhinatrema bivittatum]|uniref:testis-expressed protein 264 n=1 Tax=Rhinatrema bivittatum TaxID=194408 RepID=UPI0011261F7C|nr:testis-expressed protein 264 [Rhinatrema bivittatum]